MAPRLTGLARAAAGLAVALGSLTLAAPGVRAQTGVLLAPAVAGRPTLESRLVRDLNRYRYDVAFRLAERAGPWALRVETAYGGDAFESTGDRLAFREEARLALDARRPLRGAATVGVVTRTSAFPQSRVLRHETLALVGFRPAPEVTAEVRAGVALDDRPGARVGVERPDLRHDTGPAAALLASFERPATEARPVALRARLYAAGAALRPRRSADAVALFGLDRVASGGALGLALRYGRARRDAYQAVSFLNRDTPTGQSVEATTSDTLDAALTFDGPLAGPLRLTGQADAGRATRLVRTRRAEAGALAFDTDFARTSLGADVGVGLARRAFEARVSVRAAAATEARRLANAAALPPAQAAQRAALLAQADFDRGDLAGRLHLRGARGRLAAYLDAERSILRLDTPDENPDDRDEARASGAAGVEWRVRPGLAVSAALDGFSLHTVYLRAARSAENARQRSLRFRPALDVAPRSGSRLRLDSEVRATYTRDDFALAGRDPRDQSAREFRTDAVLEHAFAGDWRLDAEGRVSDLRLGRLLRDRFAEVPLDTIRTATLAASVTRGTRRRVGLGWRFFGRSDAERALAVRYARPDGGGEATLVRPGRRVLAQTGPTALLDLPLRRGSALRLDGWYALHRTSTPLAGPFPDGAADVLRRAWTGPWRLLPTVTFGVRWGI